MFYENTPRIAFFRPSDCLIEKIDSQTTICKILLPKFNTCWQVILERKKGILLPFYNAASRFSAQNLCHYSVMASPLHRNGDAISP